MVRDNTLLGELLVNDIPPTFAPQGVAVRFTYDMNGALEVEAKVLATGIVIQVVIERSGKPSEVDIEATLGRLRRLKLHPREALPNTAALARGDALFSELTGPARARLGEAMAVFRGLLEGQLIVASTSPSPRRSRQ